MSTRILACRMKVPLTACKCGAADDEPNERPLLALDRMALQNLLFRFRSKVCVLFSEKVPQSFGQMVIHSSSTKRTYLPMTILPSVFWSSAPNKRIASSSAALPNDTPIAVFFRLRSSRLRASERFESRNAHPSMRHHWLEVSQWNGFGSIHVSDWTQ